jgi:hypothetical protein
MTGRRRRNTLDWAVHEAAGRGATVLMMTPWAAADRVRRDAETLMAQRLRLHRMQRRGVARAVAGLDRRPLVAREIILANAATALVHAAGSADIVVVGPEATEAMRPGSLAAIIAHRLSRRQGGGSTPVVVVTVGHHAASTRARHKRSLAVTGVHIQQPLPRCL